MVKCFLERMRGVRCVPAGTPTLKSVELRESKGLEEEIDSTLETTVSPLFIEVGGCRAVVMAHLALAVTKSWEVQPPESLLRESAERRCGSFEPVSFALCTPLRERGVSQVTLPNVVVGL